MNMFFGLILLCDPIQAQECTSVRGPFFDTYEECTMDLATNGLNYVVGQYGPNVHVAYFGCIEVELQGEPA